jgi:protein ImuA
VALWCLAGRSISDSGGLYGPGLAAFCLEPRRLVVVRGRSDREVLWAMEEGLHSGVLAAVVAEVTDLSLSASRRLQLAAEAGATTALLLRPRSAALGAALGPSAALTRWRLDAAPSAPGAAGAPEMEVPARPGPIGAVRWRAELWRCRGGAPHAWTIEWCHETGDLAVVADLAHRPVEPAAARAARRRAG